MRNNKKYFLTRESSILSRIYDAQLDLLQSDQSVILGLNKDLIINTEIFCALAFKYSNKVNLTGDSLKTHCIEVSSTCDVPTTSGNDTGYPADIKKIKEIRSYVPKDKRLGIASGVDELNVSDYLTEGVTDLLVASSLIGKVVDYFDILDYQKVKKMNDLIKSF